MNIQKWKISYKKKKRNENHEHLIKDIGPTRDVAKAVDTRTSLNEFVLAIGNQSNIYSPQLILN